MVKSYALEATVRTGYYALQIHSSYVDMKDYRVERTSEIQRLIIARQLLRSV